jgi:hypothetical protein
MATSPGGGVRPATLQAPPPPSISYWADALRVLGPDHLETPITRDNLAYWRTQAEGTTEHSDHVSP